MLFPQDSHQLPRCRSFFGYDSAHQLLREKRVIFNETSPASPETQDAEAVRHRLSLLGSKVDTKIIEKQVQSAMSNLWNDEAKNTVADYLKNPDDTDIGTLKSSSGMSNNQELINIIWGIKGGKKYLQNAASLFRAQFVGQIEDMIMKQVNSASSNDKAKIQKNGSRLIEQLFAVEKSSKETVNDTLINSSRAVAAIAYLRDSGISTKLKNSDERGQLAKEMQNQGVSNVRLSPDDLALNGENWQFQQTHVLTGAIMMNVNPELLEEFILKDMIVKDYGDDQKIVIARLQNGCEGNLFTAVVKKVLPAPKPLEVSPGTELPNQAILATERAEQIYSPHATIPLPVIVEEFEKKADKAAVSPPASAALDTAAPVAPEPAAEAPDPVDTAPKWPRWEYELKATTNTKLPNELRLTVEGADPVALPLVTAPSLAAQRDRETPDTPETAPTTIDALTNKLSLITLTYRTILESISMMNDHHENKAQLLTDYFELEGELSRITLEIQRNQPAAIQIFELGLASLNTKYESTKQGINEGQPEKLNTIIDNLPMALLVLGEMDVTSTTPEQQGIFNRLNSGYAVIRQNIDDIRQNRDHDKLEALQNISHQWIEDVHDFYYSLSEGQRTRTTENGVWKKSDLFLQLLSSRIDLLPESTEKQQLQEELNNLRIAHSQAMKIPSTEDPPSSETLSTIQSDFEKWQEKVLNLQERVKIERGYQKIWRKQADFNTRLNTLKSHGLNGLPLPYFPTEHAQFAALSQNFVEVSRQFDVLLSQNPSPPLAQLSSVLENANLDQKFDDLQLLVEKALKKQQQWRKLENVFLHDNFVELNYAKEEPLEVRNPLGTPYTLSGDLKLILPSSSAPLPNENRFKLSDDLNEVYINVEPIDGNAKLKTPVPDDARDLDGNFLGYISIDNLHSHFEPTRN